MGRKRSLYILLTGLALGGVYESGRGRALGEPSYLVSDFRKEERGYSHFALTGGEDRRELVVGKNGAEKTYADFILIDREEGRFSYFTEGRKVLESEAAFSFKKGERKKAGDGTTPSGCFYICEKHRSANFNKFLRLSFPNEDYARRGRERGWITEGEYQRILRAIKKGGCPDMVSGSLGSALGIHGAKRVDLGFLVWKLDTEFDWTRGCIAVSDKDIEALYQKVGVGTPVCITD